MTEKIDVVSLIHDIKLAIRESSLTDGLLNIYVPDGRGAILIAPEGLEKDRDFVRWLKLWTEAKPKVHEEPPKRLYLSYLFGASQTVPLEKGEIKIDLNSSIYLLDFTEEKSRREIRVAIFSESPQEDQEFQF